MDAIQAVIDVVRENERLRSSNDKFEDMLESLVGAHVTFSVKQGKKTKYYECIVDEWNGEGWELINDDDDDDPEFFFATFKDFINGRLWITEK
jgi:hypothetical protein